MPSPRMPDEPPPPLLTVRDPSRPGAPLDVMASGSERAPWRPTCRQRRLGLAALLVLALSLSSAAYASHRRDLQQRDRASLAAIRLSVATAQLDVARVTPEGFESLGLRNDGPEALELLSFTLDDRRYGAVFERSLPQYGITAVDVRLPTSCPTAMPERGPETATVRVRTPRGLERDVVVRLGGYDDVVLLSRFRETCGLLLPEQAFQLDLVSAPTTKGLTTTVEVTANNRGVLPVTLTGLTFPPGLSAYLSTPLPLLLPGHKSGHSEAITLTLTVTVTDCMTARYTQSQAQGWLPVLTASIQNPDGKYQGFVPFMMTTPTPSGDEFVEYDVLRNCP